MLDKKLSSNFKRLLGHHMSLPMDPFRAIVGSHDYAALFQVLDVPVSDINLRRIYTVVHKNVPLLFFLNSSIKH